MLKCTNPAVGKYIIARDDVEDPELNRAIEKHLQECSYCQMETAQYSACVEVAKQETANHVSSDEIIAFVNDSGETALSAKQKRRIEDHLLVCRSCNGLVSQLPSLSDLISVFETEDVPQESFQQTRQNKWKTQGALPGQIDSEIEGAVSGELTWSRKIKSLFVRRVGANTHVEARPLSHPSWRLGWGSAIVILMLVLGLVVVSYFQWGRGSKNVNPLNQNLSAKQSQSSPSPDRSESLANDNVTARRPTTQLPTTTPQKASSPTSGKQEALDTQDVAIVIDPTRVVSERKEIVLSQQVIRFSVSIKGPTTTRLFQVEMIDEETGQPVEGMRRVPVRLTRDRREMTLLFPTKELMHTFYTLRLTGLTKSGETAEVFTIYLKVTK